MSESKYLNDNYKTQDGEFKSKEEFNVSKPKNNKITKMGTNMMFNKEISKKNKKKCIIYPQSKVIQAWDIIIFILILYCIIVNPIEIAFIENEKATFYINLFVDFMFMTDVVLYFFRAFERKNNEVKDDRCLIVKNYLCGWFLLDFISAFPYTLIFQSNNHVGEIVRISRLTKMTKMIRLLRFLRSIKFFNQTEKLPGCLKKLLHQDSFIKGIFRTGLFTLLMVHIVACLWKFAAEFDQNEVKDSNWLKEEAFKNLTDFEIYIACLYWAIQTVFTVGYGDFTPVTIFQLTISILAMLFGVFLFGTIISSISNIFDSMHNHSVETISLLDSLYKFRETYKIDSNLYQRCIEYILHRKTDVEEDYKVLFHSLPAEVRRAMNKEIYTKKLENIEYFKDKSEDFLGEIGPLLEKIAFSPDDQILNKGDDAEEIYFIFKGEVAVKDLRHETDLRIYKEGEVFGEWDILFNNNIRRFFVTAQTPCELYFLRKEDFDEIYFQKFTDYSNELMNRSRRAYEEMVSQEKILKGDMNYSDTDDEGPNPNQNRRNFEEVEYLDNLYHKIHDLQNKLAELQQNLQHKNQ